MVSKKSRDPAGIFDAEYPVLVDIQKSNAVRSIFTITPMGNDHIPNALAFDF